MSKIDINKDVNFVIDTLKKYHINDLLGINNEYLDVYSRRINKEYNSLKSEIWKNSKFEGISIICLKIFIILGGCLLSIIKCFWYKKRILYKSNIKSPIVALAFADRYVRFKYLNRLTETPIHIVYPPIFHYKTLALHINEFNKQKIPLDIHCFSLKGILKVGYYVISNYANMKKCSRDIDEYYNCKSNRFINILMISILYKDYIDRLLKKWNYKIVWLFDYDFDYKYIVYNSEIHKQKISDLTVHIQHGAFYGYNDAYCNPISDYSLCCSPREKAIIDENNKYKSTIISLGASLQSFDDTFKDIKVVGSKFDVTILLTDIDSKTMLDLMIVLLETIRSYPIATKVRYRPASKSIDKKILEPYTKGMTESNGTTLREDIMNSKSIISFSADAVYDCLRSNKKILYVAPDKSDYDFSHGSSDFIRITDVNHFTKDDIEFLVRDEDMNCDYMSDNFVHYNFGSVTFAEVKNNFRLLIDRILDC